MGVGGFRRHTESRPVVYHPDDTERAFPPYVYHDVLPMDVRTGRQWMPDGRVLPMACHRCGNQRPATKDHVIPKSRGGPNAWWNLVPYCVPCQHLKADDWPTCTCAFCQRAIEIHKERSAARAAEEATA